MKLSKIALIIGMCASSSLFSYNYLIINGTNQSLTVTQLDGRSHALPLESEKTQGFNQTIFLMGDSNKSISVDCSSGVCTVRSAQGIRMIDKDSADSRRPKKYILYAE